MEDLLRGLVQLLRPPVDVSLSLLAQVDEDGEAVTKTPKKKPPLPKFVQQASAAKCLGWVLL